MTFFLIGLFISILVIFFPRINAESCETPNYEPGQCVIFSNCPPLFNLNKSISSHPEMEVYKNFIKNSQQQCSRKKICCPHRHILGYQQPKVEKKRRRLEGDFLEPGSGSCGKPSINTRIVGGNITKIDEFPWMVQIGYYKNGNDYGYNCGGSLISDRYVLTAAHCLIDIEATWYPATVRLGEWNTIADTDCQNKYTLQSQEPLSCENSADSACICAPPSYDMNIDKIIIHENYENRKEDPKHILNDIALIRLQEKIKYTDFVHPICLPFTAELKSLNFEKTKMTTSGWGLTENQTASEIKRKAIVPVISLDDCQEIMIAASMNLYQTQICAGGKIGVDTCKGDSGGPLFDEYIDKENRSFFFIAGILSFGHITCGTGIPSVYTKTTEYIDWIKDNMEL